MQHITNSIEEEVSKAIQGEKGSLEVYVGLKRASIAIGNGLEAIKEQALEEAERHGSKSFEYQGAKIERRAAAGEWTYSDDTKKKSKALKAEIKNLEQGEKDAYKAAQKGQAVVNEDTGEVIQPAQFQPGPDIIAVSFPELSKRL